MRDTMYYKLLLFCFLYLSLIAMTVNGWKLHWFKKGKSIDEYKVYPLILINTDEGYRLPIDFDYGQETYRYQGHKRKFKTYENESEVFFCPAIKETTKGTKRKRDETPAPTLKRTYSFNHEVSQSCTTTKAVNNKRKTVVLKCDNESEPTIWRPNISAEENSEKHEVQLVRYGFGYKICATSLNERTKKSIPESARSIHFGIYDFYYTAESKEVYMTLHQIRSRVLLFHKNLEKERKVVHEDDTYGFDFFGDEFLKRKELFDEIEKNSEYGIQKLIPVDDFPFALWRKVTYHYINTGLMHKKLQGLWNSMEDRIRNLTQFERGTINIYTGAFKLPIPKKLLNKMGITNYVMIRKGYLIPQMWVKFIHYECDQNLKPNAIIKEMVDQPVSEKSVPTEEPKIVNKILVIIANNYLNKNLLKFIEEKFCPVNFCENYGKEEYPNVHEHVLCCFLTKYTLPLLNLKINTPEMFMIPGLTKYPPELLKLMQERGLNINKQGC